MKLILTGGFLGSGKTTAIQQACNLLLKENIKVAVVTNDQGDELVDSKFSQGFSIPVKEVTKGCFCCNYTALLENIGYFSKEIHPQIVFAESVGSCTDLVATIANPLAEMHPELTVTISVFVDSYLLWTIINGTSSFTDDSVRYIFKKQMEEADVLILNKTDLLNAQQSKEVQTFMKKEYAGKKIVLQNSLNPEDIQRWLYCLEKPELTKRKSLELDYEIYGEGEAKLAWLDASVRVANKKISALNASALLSQKIYEKIKAKGYTIGHLKFLINDGTEQFKISYTETSKNENHFFNSASIKASVLINARVQTTPKALQEIVYEAIDEVALQTNSTIQIQSISAFQPGFPKPTHRISS